MSILIMVPFLPRRLFQLLVDEVLIERRPSDAQLLRGENDVTIARFQRVHNRAPLHVLQRGQIQSCRLPRSREQLPLAVALAVQTFRQVTTCVVDRVGEIALEGEARGGIVWILVFPHPRCLCFSHCMFVLDAVHASLNSGLLLVLVLPFRFSHSWSFCS